MDSVIMLAAGASTRMGGVKKQFLSIGGICVLLRSVLKFRLAGVDEIVVVAPAEDLDQARRICQEEPIVKAVVAGGDTRQKSVQAGFSFCEKEKGLVAIHDAARPFVRVSDIQTVLSAARKSGAAALGVPIVDTVKRVFEGVIVDTLDRSCLYAVQTPQVFDKDLFAQALSSATQEYTDDCQLIEAMGHPVQMLVGSRENIKLTTRQDLLYAQLLAKEDLL